MIRYHYTKLLIAALVLWGSAFSSASFGAAPPERPNIILVSMDDMGYSDIGCFGAVGFKTPHMDKLAEEGRRFTSFLVAASCCSASRTALMTGCYPDRVNMPGVLFPTHGAKDEQGPGRRGLHPDEITMAEVLKDGGYATGIVGKWHLGDAPPFLPTKQGFDEYFGIPYSNDMGLIDSFGKHLDPEKRRPTPLFDGEKIIEWEPDQRFITRRYTERAVDFIERNKEKPFFLYLPHTMPHVRLFVHPDFEGTSEHGMFGDVMQEIDWSIGEIVRTLKENNLEEKTMIVITSDNGPWLQMGENGGHAVQLRAGKFSRYEGGHRVACIMYWKGQIKPGTVAEEMLSSLDLMPTFAKLAGTTMPQDRKTDGIEAWDYISGATDVSPRKTFVYGPRVIRHGKWRLFLPGEFEEYLQRDNYATPQEWRAALGARGSRTYESSRLFDLEVDLKETQDVSERYPEVVADLTQRLKDFTEEMRTESRPIGVWENWKGDEAMGRIRPSNEKFKEQLDVWAK